MRRFLERMMPLREGEGLGGAGGAGGETTWTPPDGLPKEFIGADAQETLTKLVGGYADLNTRFGGLREKLSTMPKAPEKPEAYTFKPDEKLAPYFGDDLDKNPALVAARQAFHKHGIPDSAFSGIINDVYLPLIEQGVIGAPFDPARELKAFQEAFSLDRDGTVAALKEAETFANGLTAQLKVPDAMKEDVKALMLGLTDTAAGNALIRALSSRLAENGIRIAGEGGAGGPLTEADIKKLTADPRIDPANRDHPDVNRRFDPELRKKYDDWYAAKAAASR